MRGFRGIRWGWWLLNREGKAYLVWIRQVPFGLTSQLSKMVSDKSLFGLSWAPINARVLNDYHPVHSPAFVYSLTTCDQRELLKHGGWWSDRRFNENLFTQWFVNEVQ
jgi:hypothetical protein